MNKNQKVLIKLLNCAIRKETQYNTINKKINWDYIISEATEHQVYPLLYPVARALPSNIISDAIKEEWKAYTLKSALYLNRQILQLSKVLQAFNTSGIPVIALKGLILRNLYPVPDLRTMGDADILVHKDDLNRVKDLLKYMGYVEAKDSTPAHIAFIHKQYCPIEVHWTLSDDRYLDDKSYFEQELWKGAVAKTIGTTSIMCLCSEDFLIHLCIHMAVHMRSGGFGLRQLCDLVLLVENEFLQISWISFHTKVKQIGIEKFTAAIFNVCNRLFDLQIPREIRSIHVDNRYIKMLIKDIFDSGVFGSKSLDRIFGNNLLNAEVVFNTKNSTKMNSVINLIFPPVDTLSNDYAYAKKYKILIPIAWIHHFFAGIFNKDYNLIDKLNFLLFSTLTFKKRNELIKKLEL